MIPVDTDTQVHLNCLSETILLFLHALFCQLLKISEDILLPAVMKMLVGYTSVYI